MNRRLDPNASIYHALVLVVALALSSHPCAGDDDLRVLPLASNRPQTAEMMRQYLRKLAHEAFDDRLDRLEFLQTGEQIKAYQENLYDQFVEHLGGFFEKTPLNANVVGGVTHSDYRLQKIIFESQPRYYVTGNLYLPKTPPPYPCVLLLCGHAADAKAYGLYQKAALLMVKNGLAVFCIDPLGQGERMQILDGSGEPLYSSTTEHMLAAVAPILLGRSLATYMIWDAIRAIDYLESREDILDNQFACTGNSGGGNRTSYLMALDKRIVAAAPGCFITTNRRKNERPGPGDAEQNIYGQIQFGMDHPDYIIMRAPKPTLICSATHDYVPIEGAWEAFRQAKRVYANLGFAEKVDLVETSNKHGFDRVLRTAAARWMSRWLLGEDRQFFESDTPVEAREALNCSPQGQVQLINGANSIYDLYAEEEKHLAKRRQEAWSKLETLEKKASIRRVIGAKALDELPAAHADITGTIPCNGYQIEKVVLSPEPNILLPGLVFKPDGRIADLVLYLHGLGKHADARADGEMEKLVQAGHIVFAIDLRGIGETATTVWRYPGTTKWMGPSTAEFFIAYMLGKSFLGMRTEDILQAARWLNQEYGAQARTARIRVIAQGEAGPPALHAIALEEDLFQSITLQKTLISWKSIFQTKETFNALIHCVHGAMKVYDLPDLVAMIGQERVELIQPVNAAGEVVQ